MGQTATGDLETALTAAKLKLAPDRRTAVFDVSGRLEGQELFLSGEIQSQGMKSALLGMLSAHGWSVRADSLIALPHPALGGQSYGVVSVSVMNIRTKPDHGAEMGTQALLGTPLTVLKKERGWYLLQTPDSYLGYSGDRFQLMDEAAFQEWTARPKLIITSTYASCTALEGEDIVSDLVAGDILALTGTDEKGFQVQYPDGRLGRVRREDARLYEEWLGQARDTPETILATARRFMGIPYLWGGTSCKGMDCSGFTKTVYFLNGVLLPRDASQQAMVGEDVQGGDSLDQFEPGDLLFFGFRGSADQRERVTHVGISLGGRRFIHESGDVHIQSLNPSDSDYSDRRRQMFLRARRVIGTGPDTGILRLKEIPYYAPHAH